MLQLLTDLFNRIVGHPVAEPSPMGDILVTVRTGKIRVIKRGGSWHWWCPCCMGGDWFEYIEQAWRDADRHIEKIHQRVRTAA